MVTLYLTGNISQMPSNAKPIKCDVFSMSITKENECVTREMCASKGILVLN